jgi:GntR family transcriptional regulator of arabinose operon
MTTFNPKLPKYVMIKESIRKDIDDGVLVKDDKLPPEQILIVRFKASKMTVIRALQELVQEGYLVRAQGSGTFVSSPQKHLPLIGVLVPGFSHGIYSILLRSIEKYTHDLGYSIMLCCTDSNTEKAENFANELINRNAKGIIAVPLERVENDEENMKWYKLFEDANIPVVLLDRGIPSIPHSVLVDTSNEESMVELTTLLKERGFQRLLYIMEDGIQSTTSQNRIKGFFHAAKQEPPAALAEVYNIDFTQSMTQTLENFEQALTDYEPDVVLAYNDVLALELFGLLKRTQTGIGLEVSITGFDDLSFAEAIGLTTVKQPLDDESRMAVHLLHQMINGKSVQSVRLPCQVTERATTKKTISHI